MNNPVFASKLGDGNWSALLRPARSAARPARALSPDSESVALLVHAAAPVHRAKRRRQQTFAGRAVENKKSTRCAKSASASFAPSHETPRPPALASPPRPNRACREATAGRTTGVSPCPDSARQCYSYRDRRRPRLCRSAPASDSLCPNKSDSAPDRKVPVIHVMPPVVASGVPAGGVLSHLHCILPVSGSTDLRNPVRLSKSPETPTITWLLTTRGDIVVQ